ncbi:MAG: hypothetical protein IJM62_06750, partial [Lachnospiraceae bacterium]|nr:hypothetical protein [Lachnospiraceae bacterium]
SFDRKERKCGSSTSSDRNALCALLLHHSNKTLPMHDLTGRNGNASAEFLLPNKKADKSALLPHRLYEKLHSI